MSIEVVINQCQKRGINCLAVTDHNTIAGALDIQRVAPFKIIVGEEIYTRQGEIMGLFLTEEIPRGLSLEESVARIKAQGGLVGVPHPFDRWRPSTLERSALGTLLPHLDIIEVFNARTTFNSPNHEARQFAVGHGLPMTAGSDAHTPFEIGKTYMEMEDFSDKTGFLSRLAGARIVGKRSSFLVHAVTAWTKQKHRIRRRFRGIS